MCNNKNQSYTRATWNNNSINDFKSNIDAEQILQVSNNLDLLLQGRNENMNFEGKINDICGKVSKILVSAAENSGLIITKPIINKKHNKHNIQPWFNEDCERKRQSYLKAKQNFRRLNSQSNYNYKKCP